MHSSKGAGCISFDHGDMKVSESGLIPYYWPVRQQEVSAVSAAIINALKSVLAGPLRQGDEDARYAYAVSAPLFMELLSLFGARLLATRCHADGVMPRLPADATLWRSAFHGEAYPEIRALRILRQGVPRPATWRRLARPFADLARTEFFRRRPIEFVNSNDVVTVTPCPLSRKHAEQTGIRPVYTPLYEWFYPATKSELASDPLKPISPVLRDDLVGALEDVFAQAGAGRAKVPPRALPELIDDATALARFYLRRIERRPNRIPKRLWKGSSGVVWSRLLADAVQAHGGVVTGHDHAYGANYSEDTLIPFTELQSNDVFITYTAAHAALYERIAQKLQIGPSSPQIVAMRHRATGGASHAGSKGEPRSLLYVPSFLSNGRLGAMPHFPPVMAIDWQARLYTMLKAMGIAVTQKPHPESAVAPLPVFARDFGVQTSNRRFEDVMAEYDVVLFDFAPQTCFGSALRSNQAMVLVDFGVTRYGPDLRAMLERRCAIVPGTFDVENRAHVDPGALREAISRAGALRDHAFADAIISL
jgi:hypothetical protein